MLGFVAALGAELTTQTTVMEQFRQAPLAISATVLVLVVATLVPILRGAKREAFGPLTPAAEVRGWRGVDGDAPCTPAWAVWLPQMCFHTPACVDRFSELQPNALCARGTKHHDVVALQVVNGRVAMMAMLFMFLTELSTHRPIF